MFLPQFALGIVQQRCFCPAALTKDSLQPEQAAELSGEHCPYLQVLLPLNFILPLTVLMPDPRI